MEPPTIGPAAPGQEPPSHKPVAKQPKKEEREQSLQEHALSSVMNVKKQADAVITRGNEQRNRMYKEALDNMLKGVVSAFQNLQTSNASHIRNIAKSYAEVTQPKSESQHLEKLKNELNASLRELDAARAQTAEAQEQIDALIKEAEKRSSDFRWSV